MFNYKKLTTVILSCIIVFSCISCESEKPKKNKDTKKCEKLISDYAYHFTENECEELCKLMFTDEMIADCNKVYYANMHLDITNRNLIFKQGLSDMLFKTIEYSFEDISFSKLSKNDLESVQSYYKTYLNYDITIDDGYLACATYKISEGLEYPVEFPIIKIEDDWKISPQLWHTLFGQPLESFHRTYENVQWY